MMEPNGFRGGGGGFLEGIGEGEGEALIGESMDG